MHNSQFVFGTESPAGKHRKHSGRKRMKKRLQISKKNAKIKCCSMIAGSFDVFAGKLLRIGHMGENANEGDVRNTLQALKEIIDKKSHIL